MEEFYSYQIEDEGSEEGGSVTGDVHHAHALAPQLSGNQFNLNGKRNSIRMLRW